MNVYLNLGITGESLTLEIRNLDAARTLALTVSMTETNAYGEYTATLALPVGGYHARSLNSAGATRTTGYLGIKSPTEYHFVNGYDDLHREPTTQEMNDQLADDFAPSQRPGAL